MYYLTDSVKSMYISRLLCSILQDSAFPLYDQVKAEHVVPGITQLLADLNAEIDRLEQSVQPTFEGLVEPLERISDRLGRAWGTVSHLKAGTHMFRCPPGSGQL